MAYSGVLLVLTVFSICNYSNAAAAALASTAFSGVGFLLDAFDFGLGIYDMITSSRALESTKKEILAKLDTVQRSIDELHQTVLEVLSLIQKQLSLEKVDAFERSTTNRMVKAGDIVTAKTTEKAYYWAEFLNGMDKYLDDHLREILPYVIEPSQSLGKSPLQMVREQTDCHLTKFLNFSAYVHNLVLSGISLETLYKKQKYPSITLTKETEFWQKALNAFDAAVAVQVQICNDKFQTYFTEYIKLNSDSPESHLSELESRFNKLFCVVALEGNDITVSNKDTPTFQCACQIRSGTCFPVTCFLYYVNGTNCEDIVAFKIIGLNKYKIKMSKGLPVTIVEKAETNTDLIRPSPCQKYDAQVSLKTFSYVSASHLHEITTSGSISPSEQPIILLASVLVAATVAC